MNFNTSLLYLCDLFFPQKCHVCRISINFAYNNTLCDNCWNSLYFITKPYCSKCGRILNLYDMYSFNNIIINEDHNINTNIYAVNNTKLKCITCKLNHRKLYYNNIRSSLIYNDIAQLLIKKFKYNNDIALKHLFVKWMMIAGADILQKADFIIPVPLHKKKLFQRKYNQSALLAIMLAKISGNKCLLDCIERKVNVKSQSNMNGADRWNNVNGIFSLNEKYKDLIKDSTIILIDDVVTTSATVNECAKVLRVEKHSEESVYFLKNKPHDYNTIAKNIFVLSIART